MRLIALVLAGFVLSACAETEFLVHSAKRVEGVFGGETEPGYKVGEPYQIQGVWYYPAEDYEYDATGIASWYGVQFHGRRTANGEVYDMNALTAAHRTLPMPSFVRITNLENGRSLILKVNDRGPFARGRIIDVSRRASQLLGFHDVGTARVRVQIMADKSRAIAVRMRARTQLAEADTPITVGRLPKPEVKTETLAPPPGANPAPAVARGPAVDGTRRDPPARERPPPVVVAAETAAGRGSDVVTIRPVRKTNLFVQAGAFSQYENANRVRARLSSVGPVKVTSVLVNGRDLFRVRVGPLTTVDEADGMLESVTQAGYPDARIVVD
ncbi:MAG: septal ring lytic transglycosylase RlpA family protein [Rhodospirillales bacterium]